MVKKKLLPAIIVLTILLITGFLLIRKQSQSDVQYTYGKITRGDIETSISSTGTLRAVGTVEVGTQVSGIIDKILVDFNDTVQKDQVLAILDTTTLAVMVCEARANLQKNQALYEQAKYEFERNTELYKQKLVSEQDYINSKTTLRTSESSREFTQISLERALSNLSYAFIRSPIDGKVIYRNVEEGQTVAASLSTPTLFIIAEDLTSMEILALVDESDIGTVKEEQAVRFTVQTYQDLEFTGKVRQIWLQPESISNVVNYTVVIDAENQDHYLLPGMTATVDFIIDSRENVLLVPNTALKIQPTEKMIEILKKQRQNQINRPSEFRQEIGEANFTENSESSGGTSLQNGKRRMPSFIWYLDNEKQMVPVMVKTGLSDSKNTVLEFGPGLSKNMTILTHVISKSDGNVTPTMNRMPQGMGGGMRPPRF